MIASLLPQEERFRLNSEGADIGSRNVLTFIYHCISIYEILTMRYCRWRGKVNRNGVANSKRSLFLLIVTIAAACSALRERAAFATSLDSSERTPLQLCFHVRIVYGASQSFYVKSVKDGNFRFHDLLGVFLSLCVGDLF